MRLAVSPVPGRTAKLRVEKAEVNGNIVDFCLIPKDTVSPDDYRKAAKRLGVSYNVLLDFIENKYKKDNTKNELDLSVTVTPITVFSVRSEHSNTTDNASDFAAALALCKGDGVIEWGSTDNVCCLDIDFHGDAPAPTHDLIALCQTVRPAPLWFWSTKRGGVHLMYEAHGDYTAEDFAAVAAYAFYRRFPLAGFEFLHRTRQPTGKYFTRTADNDPDAIRRLLTETIDGDYSEWLEEKGYVVGQRYPHTQCPVEPYTASEGNSGPVVVHADHIFCYHCQSKGTVNGSKTPGYFPLATLAGLKTASSVSKCVENFVHYGHAQHILGTCLPAALVKRIYRSLLRIRWGNDERVPLVFTVCQKNGLIRFDGYWGDNEGKILTLDSGSAILKSLPHCKRINADGDLEVKQDDVEYLCKPINHTVRGYFAVNPLRGIHMTQFQETPPNKFFTVLHTANLTADNMQSRRPRYLPESSRMELEAAWNVLEGPFPGLDRRLVEILLVGRGCFEHRSGLPPMLFLKGVTGAGKTSHVLIAAAIAGDALTTVQFTKDSERLHQSVMTGKQDGAFVMFDEFFKKAVAAKVPEMDAMQTLLSFTRDQVSHQLYIGPVPMGDLPFFVWADNKVPEAVMKNEQIGRRMHYHSMPDEIKWEPSLRACNITDPRNLRSEGSPDIIAACNAILSYVMDKWFSEGITDFAEVAKELGINKLRSSSAVKDKHNAIRDLFDVVCKAPAPPKAENNSRFKARAKRFRADPVDPIYNVMQSIWEESEQLTCRSVLLHETDLRQVLGLKHRVDVYIRNHGSNFAIAFHNPDETLFNEELI